MRKPKRLLSLFLAAVMALSALTVGMTAFAADGPAAIAEQLMQQLWDNKTNINTARPADADKAAAYDEKLELYQRVIAAYQPLDDEQRDSIEIVTSLRFLSAVVMREAYVIKEEYDQNHIPVMTAIESRKQAQDKMPAILGVHTARDEALAIAKAHLFEPYKDNLKVSQNMNFDCPEAKDAFLAYKQAYMAASPMVRRYMDGINATYYSFSRYTVGTKFLELVKMELNLYLAENPYVTPDGSTTPPRNPISPKPALGTPEYADWLEGQRVNKQWTADKTEYSNRQIMVIIQELGALPDFADAVRVMLDMNKAYRAFIEKSDEEACKNALEAYEALDAYSQKLVSSHNNGAYYYIFLNNAGTDYTYSNLNYTSLASKCNEVGGMVLVREFQAWLDSVDIADADNAMAEAAREAYKKVPVAVNNKISAEAMDRYRAILAKSTYIDDIERDHTVFDGVSVSMDSSPVTGIIGNTLLPNLNTLLTMALGNMTGNTGMDLTALLQSYFTNDTVTMLAKAVPTALAPMLGNSAGMFNLVPNKLAKQLTEAQFASAKAELEKYEAWEDIPADLVLDWGVQTGDYDSFMTAALASLRGIGSGAGWSLVLNGAFKTLFLNKYGRAPGGGNDHQLDNYSIYELALIPLFEALGADNVMTAAEYEASVLTSYRIEDFLRPIMDQLYEEVLLKLTVDPTGWLLKNMPNLIYHLDDGCILGGLNKATDFEIFQVGNLQGLLNGLLGEDWSFEGLLNNFLDLSALGITYQDITMIAQLGTAEKITSKSFVAPDSIRVVADEDSVAAYLVNAINSLVTSLGVDFTVHGAFVKQEMPQYPHNGKMGKDVIKAMINGLDGMLNGIVNLNDTINTALFTQEMAANAITGIYGFLNSAELASVFGTLNLNFTPKMVADAMTEDKYRELAADLTFTDPAMNTWDNVALVIKNDDNVLIDQTDMGFKDGDRQGFVDCITAALRPLVKLLVDTGMLTNSDTGYGLYETLIIPTFEALGVAPATDSVTYTDNYAKLSKKADPSAAYDYLIKTVLSPVLDLLDQLAASPAATLMKLLPNLAYAVQYNPQLAFIGNLLTGENGKIDLAGMLNGLVQGIQTGEDTTGIPIYGFKSFALPAIDLDALASCGNLVEKTSKSQLKKTYTNVQADEADAFVTVFYYLYDTMNYNSNMNTVKELLNGLDGVDETLQGLLDSILNEVFTQGKEEALCMMGGLLASDVWECPVTSTNSGKGTPSTGDTALPAGIFLVIMVTAGCAVYLLKKKKTAGSV